jgi:hypothetical protein
LFRPVGSSLNEFVILDGQWNFRAANHRRQVIFKVIAPRLAARALRQFQDRTGSQ